MTMLGEVRPHRHSVGGAPCGRPSHICGGVGIWPGGRKGRPYMIAVVPSGNGSSLPRRHYVGVRRATARRTPADSR